MLSTFITTQDQGHIQKGVVSSKIYRIGNLSSVIYICIYVHSILIFEFFSTKFMFSSGFMKKNKINLIMGFNYRAMYWREKIVHALFIFLVKRGGGGVNA